MVCGTIRPRDPFSECIDGVAGVTTLHNNTSCGRLLLWRNNLYTDNATDTTTIPVVSCRWETVSSFITQHLPDSKRSAKETLAKAKELQKMGEFLLVSPMNSREDLPHDFLSSGISNDHKRKVCSFSFHAAVSAVEEFLFR